MHPKRIHSQEDRRSVLIRLSAKGVELLGKVYKALGRYHRELFERAFARAEMKLFNELLARFIRTLEAEL
jgi:DNA-binding MarR family transcriptional regulator